MPVFKVKPCERLDSPAVCAARVAVRRKLRLAGFDVRAVTSLSGHRLIRTVVIYHEVKRQKGSGHDSKI